jgi:type II secretory pathway pseudopilin PulG
MRKLDIEIRNKKQEGFTLVELLVSVGIFVMMTTLFVTKYGTFNQNVLLTNLAYDVALTIRTAQTYGLSIKGTGVSNDIRVFQNSYGVSFSTQAPDNERIILFSSPISKPAAFNDKIFDRNSNENPLNGDAIITTYRLKRGAVISRLCVGNGSCDNEVNELSIDFKRPDPAAIICAGMVDWNTDQSTAEAMTCATNDTYAEIDVHATDGSVRTIQVRSNGQISVGN